MPPTSNRSSASSALTWLRSLIHRDRWVALDIETTGLHPGAEPVEIALVSPSGDLLFHSLVRPHRSIDPRATRLHHLDASSLASAPLFQHLHPTLDHLLHDRDIVAYHADFDRRILDQACRNIALPPFPAAWHCAHRHYTAWRGFTASLTTACEIEGIPLTPHHRAATDAYLLWHLLKKMSVAANDSSIFDN